MVSGSPIVAVTIAASVRWPPISSASDDHVAAARSPRYADSTSATTTSTSSRSATRKRCVGGSDT